jgi:hypothetical protein
MSESTEVQVLIEKIKKKSNWAKWGIGLVGVLLLAPLVWAMAYAILGAAFLGTSLALAAAVGLVVINYTPVFMMKLQNARINAIIAEANKNPIPTLWNEFEKDTVEVDEMEAAIGEKVEIERASAIWDLGMAMNKANAKNLAAQRESTISRIKKETALDSVTASMNRGKVALRQRINSRRRVADEGGAPRLGMSTPDVIEMPLTSGQRVAR